MFYMGFYLVFVDIISCVDGKHKLMSFTEAWGFRGVDGKRTRDFVILGSIYGRSQQNVSNRPNLLAWLNCSCPKARQ